MFQRIEPGISNNRRWDTDASVTTGQLEAVFYDFMNETGRRDLATIFAELEVAVGFHSGPGRAVAAISKLYPFYVRILRLCSNGVLPRSRMRQALVNLNERRDIHGMIPYMWNYDGPSTVDAAHAICEIARVGAAKLRDLKQSGKRYIHSMYGQPPQCITNINQLIDMITLVNSHTTEAMVVARQYARVDSTGCCMDIFERVLSGELTRPLRHDSSNESLVADPSEVPGPGVNPKDMRSSDNVAETDLDTQTTTEDAGSSGTNEGVQLVPGGVDTAHASTSLVAGEPPVTPRLKRLKGFLPSGSVLDRPSAEKTNDVDELSEEAFAQPKPAAMPTTISQPKKNVAIPFWLKKQNVCGPVKKTVPAKNGRDSRRDYQKNAFQCELRQAKALGKSEPVAQAYARKAYHRAGAEFDNLAAIFG